MFVKRTIIKNDYDLSAKNPNKTKGIVYKKPEVLIEDIAKKENQINELINEVVDLLQKSN